LDPKEPLKINNKLLLEKKTLPKFLKKKESDQKIIIKNQKTNNLITIM